MGRKRRKFGGKKGRGRGKGRGKTGLMTPSIGGSDPIVAANTGQTAAATSTNTAIQGATAGTNVANTATTASKTAVTATESAKTASGFSRFMGGLSKVGGAIASPFKWLWRGFKAVATSKVLGKIAGLAFSPIKWGASALGSMALKGGISLITGMIMNSLLGGGGKPSANAPEFEVPRPRSDDDGGGDKPQVTSDTTVQRGSDDSKKLELKQKIAEAKAELSANRKEVSQQKQFASTVPDRLQELHAKGKPAEEKLDVIAQLLNQGNQVANEDRKINLARLNQEQSTAKARLRKSEDLYANLMKLQAEQSTANADSLKREIKTSVGGVSKSMKKRDIQFKSYANSVRKSNLMKWALFGGIFMLLKKGYEYVSEKIGPGIGKVVDFIKEGVEKVGDFFKPVVDGIKGVAEFLGLIPKELTNVSEDSIGKDITIDSDSSGDKRVKELESTEKKVSKPNTQALTTAISGVNAVVGAGQAMSGLNNVGQEAYTVEDAAADALDAKDTVDDVKDAKKSGSKKSIKSTVSDDVKDAKKVGSKVADDVKDAKATIKAGDTAEDAAKTTKAIKSAGSVKSSKDVGRLSKISKFFNSLDNKVNNWVSNTTNKVKNSKIGKSASNIWGKVRDFGSKSLSKAKSVVKSVSTPKSSGSWFSNAWNKTKNFVSDSWTKAKKVGSKVAKKVGTVATKVKTAVVNFAESAWSGFKNTMLWPLKKLLGPKVFNALTKQVNKIVSVIKNLGKKAGSKLAGRAVPGVGLILDLVDTVLRVKDGDYVGAVISGIATIGQAIATCFPGATMVSGMISAACAAINMARDFSNDPESKELQKLSEDEEKLLKEGRKSDLLKKRLGLKDSVGKKAKEVADAKRAELVTAQIKAIEEKAKKEKWSKEKLAQEKNNILTANKAEVNASGKVITEKDKQWIPDVSPDKIELLNQSSGDGAYLEPGNIIPIGKSPFGDYNSAITSNYMETNPDTGKKHIGIDFSSVEDADVLVPRGGVVRNTGKDEHGGAWASINTPEGVTYIYDHLKPGSVKKKGSKIKVGESIGKVLGNSKLNGNKDPHIHLDTRINNTDGTYWSKGAGTPINPLRALAGNYKGGPEKEVPKFDPKVAEDFDEAKSYGSYDHLGSRKLSKVIYSYAPDQAGYLKSSDEDGLYTGLKGVKTEDGFKSIDQVWDELMSDPQMKEAVDRIYSKLDFVDQAKANKYNAGGKAYLLNWIESRGPKYPGLISKNQLAIIYNKRRSLGRSFGTLSSDRDYKEVAKSLGMDEAKFRTLYVIRKLIEAGFTPEQAAGIAGGLYAESMMTSDFATADYHGDGRSAGQSGGLACWNSNAGRLGGLKNYAISEDLEWNAMDTQIKYILDELNNTGKPGTLDYSKLKAKLEAAKSPSTAADEWADYERYVGWNDPNSDARKKRRDYAEQFLIDLNKSPDIMDFGNLGMSKVPLNGSNTYSELSNLPSSLSSNDSDVDSQDAIDQSAVNFDPSRYQTGDGELDLVVKREPHKVSHTKNLTNPVYGKLYVNGKYFSDTYENNPLDPGVYDAQGSKEGGAPISGKAQKATSTKHPWWYWMKNAINKVFPGDKDGSYIPHVSTPGTGRAGIRIHPSHGRGNGSEGCLTVGTDKGGRFDINESKSTWARLMPLMHEAGKFKVTYIDPSTTHYGFNKGKGYNVNVGDLDDKGSDSPTQGVKATSTTSPKCTTSVDTDDTNPTSKVISENAQSASGGQDKPNIINAPTTNDNRSVINNNTTVNYYTQSNPALQGQV